MTITIDEQSAPKISEYVIAKRGLALWKSANLSNPGREVWTPAITVEGDPYPKPDWQCESSPSEIVFLAEQINVVTYREVKRFHVGLRRGGGFMSWKLTDAASERVWREVDKATEALKDAEFDLAVKEGRSANYAYKSASYTFDYDTQDAVIIVPDKVVTMAEWLAARQSAQTAVPA